MGSAAQSPPSDFSLQLIEFIRHELKKRGADVSGRWLAERTPMSSTYIHTRLIGQKAFTTTDIEEIAIVFGFTPGQFVHAAVKAHEQRRDGRKDESIA